MLSPKGLPKGQRGLVRLHGVDINKVLHVSGPLTLRLPSSHYVLTIPAVRIDSSEHGVQSGAVAYPARRHLRTIVRPGKRTTVVAQYAGIVNPATKPLPGNVLGFVGSSKDPGAVILSARRKAPDVGTIFISGPTSNLPRGLISEVTAVKRHGSEFITELMAVPITDAVPSLAFEGDIDFRLAASAASARITNERAHASSACSPPKLLKFGAHLDSFELRQASLGTWPRR